MDGYEALKLTNCKWLHFLKKFVRILSKIKFYIMGGKGNDF